MFWSNLIKSILLFCAMAFVAAWFADKFLMPWFVTHRREVVVPNIQNQTYAEAKVVLERAGLAVSQKKRFDNGFETGHVIQQIPEAGTTVKPGRTIELIVADHDRLVSVPLLKLSTLRDARFNLESLGLNVGKIDSQSSNEFPAGIILAQSIDAAEKVSLGSVVDLTVSTGNNLLEAKVPYLINKSLMEAKSLIAESGLRLGQITKKYDQQLLPGTVILQSLDSSKTVAPLSAIDLTVSSTDKEDE